MSQVRKDKKGRILRTGEGQRSDGKYYYRYTDLYGERRCAYSWRLVATDSVPNGKRDNQPLREQEQQINKDMADGLAVGSKKITLNDLFELHMKMRRFADSTEENYRYMWKKFVKDEPIAKIDVKEVRKSHVAIFYRSMSDRGMADGTIQVLHKMIYPSFQIAVDDELIRKNPAHGCCKEYTEIRNEKFALSLEQQGYFMGLFDKYEIRFRGKYKLLFRVMLGTACRIGEIVGLTWDNVDMKKREITINHAVLYRRRKGKVQFYASAVKTSNGNRVIPMTDEVYECFVRLRENRFRHRSKVDVDGYSDFVFTSSSGTPIYPANVNRLLKKIVDRNNEDPEREMVLPAISCHIFRHTGCTRMAEAGIDPNTLQYIMGHGDLKMIMEVYDHVSLSRAKAQMEKMNDRQAV